MEQLVGGRYSVGRRLGHGAFGQIHLGTDVNTQEKVAIKFESRETPYPRLYFESKVYSDLGAGSRGRFPKVRWYGRAGKHYALVMDLLGSNLEKIFIGCGGKFSLKTVLMLAAQMLRLMEYVHSKSYIHRDIKPDNFTMGVGKQATQVFMIDYGIAKQYREMTTHEHMPYRDGLPVIGTAIFASINSHDGIEITRRDDLESLGYVFVYFLTGSLPWMSIEPPEPCKGWEMADASAAYFRKVREEKVSTYIEDLCHGLPSEFKSYFRYVHGLRFDEAPDYAYLDKLFKDLFVRKGYRYDLEFDWIKDQQPQPATVQRSSQSRREGKRSVVPSTKDTSSHHSKEKSSGPCCSAHCKHGSSKSKFSKSIKGFFGL